MFLYTFESKQSQYFKVMIFEEFNKLPIPFIVMHQFLLFIMIMNSMFIESLYENQTYDSFGYDVHT